jgi:phage tail sheath protein FI
MPQYLSPGVYVEEVSAGPTPIAGVSTSTAGFVGMTRRGPTTGRPALVTNWGQFVRTFGGFFNLGATFAEATKLPYAMEGFFANGGQRAYVVRVVASDATAASTTTTGGLRTRLTADTVTTPAAAAKVLHLATLRGIQVGTKVQLRMTKDGVTTTSAVLDVTDVNRTNATVTLNNAPSTTDVFTARDTVVFTDVKMLNADGDPATGTGLIETLGTPTDPAPASFKLRARSGGSWSREVAIEARHESAASSRVVSLVSGANDDNKLKVLSTAGFYPGAWVEIDRGKTKRYRLVKSVDGPVLTLRGPALAAGDVAPELAAPNDYTSVSSCEFSLVVSVDGVTERFGGLTVEPVTGRHYVTRLAGSTLVEPFDPAPAHSHPFLFPSGTDGLSLALDTGGSDGSAPPDAFAVKGVDNGPGQKTGLRALEEVDEVSILAAPGLTDDGVQDALVEQCERLKDRFAILDPKPGGGGLPTSLVDIETQRQRFDTSYAALYYPHIMMTSASTGQLVAMPPSGHVAGIYARVDDSRGVHKAPANEVIRDCLDLEVTVTKGEHDVLNPLNINVIRNFRADRRGLRVYGARCLTSDESFRYVNVRRLFLFLEESLDEGTQWVVFEPNDERLWARVRQSVEIFLTRVWRDGALMGTKPEEAFFVRCDRSTMSDDDILNGRLILEIGVAPVRPAEFVIIRIGQWLGGSAVQEL